MESFLRDLGAYRLQKKDKKQSRKNTLYNHKKFLKEEKLFQGEDEDKDK